MTNDTSRRQLTSRDKTWAKRAASWLTQRQVSPNSISITSALFAAAAGVLLILSASDSSLASVKCRALILIGAVACILGRLLCNLLDGMVAIEGGRKTPSGEVFNDLPDRLSDFFIFVGMGYAAAVGSSEPSTWIQAGWAAALLAIFTAYIRYLGAGSGAGYFFNGPMAKQHRMAVSIAASLLSALLEPQFISFGLGFRTALVLVILGTVLTSVNRVRKIIQKLENKS